MSERAKSPKPEFSIRRMSADSLFTIVPRALSQRTGTVARPVKCGSARA